MSAVRVSRSPRDYRSLGVMLDRGRKHNGGRRYDLVLGLWWVDVAVWT